MDPELLWLWCRPAAVAPIQLLVWELPYAVGVAIKKQRKPQKTKHIQLTLDIPINSFVSLLTNDDYEFSLEDGAYQLLVLGNRTSAKAADT